MAKRKRLSPAVLTGGPDTPALETKASNGWVGVRPRAPIADVSRDAAAQSAIEEVAAELRAAKSEGRMVVRLPLTLIDETHLVRDRMDVDAEDMAVLTDSLRDRGQQTPIEVVELEEGSYGLISGWRRLQALRGLQAEGAEGFDHVQALIRAPNSAADAYRAMIEENEIRADLSFYERARIALKASEQGVYGDVRSAVQSLYAALRPPKRSKIQSFVTLVEALDDRLRFASAIPEKLGLSLVSGLRSTPDLKSQLREALRKADAQDAASERRVLERVLTGAPTPRAASDKAAPAASKAGDELRPGVVLVAKAGKITLSGSAVDAALAADLEAWLKSRP
ncbi:MAG: ParB/RepB/Spo0J family partition protein [Phaeobacter italicus]